MGAEVMIGAALTHRQRREAIRGRDGDGEAWRSIGRGYNGPLS